MLSFTGNHNFFSICAAEASAVNFFKLVIIFSYIQWLLLDRDWVGYWTVPKDNHAYNPRELNIYMLNDIIATIKLNL